MIFFLISSLRCIWFNGDLRVATTHTEKHSYSSLIHYTLMEMVDIFRLCAVLGQYVASTNSSPVVSHIVSSPPHRVRHAQPQRGSSRILWSVIRVCDSALNSYPGNVDNMASSYQC